MILNYWHEATCYPTLVSLHIKTKGNWCTPSRAVEKGDYDAYADERWLTPSGLVPRCQRAL